MSQAKDYAKAVEEAKILRPREFLSGSLRAHVTEDGGLSVRLNNVGYAPAKDALDFASYIFEVLGEGPPPNGDDDVPF